jgi:transposase-like protein
MTTVNRKRRHFRDDFKRNILAGIESGKLNIHNVKDETGKPIKALLVERWKDQFRTEGVGMGYESPTQFKTISQPKVQGGLTFSTDDLLKEIGRLELENRQLRAMAYKSQQSKAPTYKEVSAPKQIQSL